MISLIISIIPLIIIIYYFIIIESNGGMNIYIKSLSAKKMGSICYNCSCDVDPNSKPNWFNNDASLCRSCERDHSVKTLISPIKSRLYKFNKYFFNKKFEKYQTVILIVSISLIFINIFLSFFDIKITSIPANILLSIYWSMMVYRVKISLKGYFNREVK